MLSKVSFLILFILSCFLVSCKTNGEPCIYLIPKGFEGNVIVAFDQEDGKDMVFEGQSRIYQIDSNGVLKTKFPKNRKSHQVDFYSVDDKGNRVVIPFYVTFKDIKDSSQVIALAMVPGNDYDTKHHKQRYFELFLVSKAKNVDSLLEERSAFMWKQLP